MKKLKTYRLRFLIMLALLAVVAVGYFTAGGIGNFCGIGFESITLLCPPGRAAGHDRRAHSHPDGRDQRCGRAAGVYRARQGVLRLGVPRAFYVAR